MNIKIKQIEIMKNLNETQKEVLTAILGITLAFTPIIIMAIFQYFN